MYVIDHTIAFAIDAPMKASDIQKLDQNIDELDGRFNPTTGHRHNGADSRELGGDPCMGTCFLGFKNFPQNSTRYFGVLGTTEVATIPGESTSRYTPHSPVTIRDLYVSANAAPPSGQTFTVTLRKNGVDTALTAQITNTSTKVSNLTDSVDFGTQDKISFRCVSSATTGSTIDLVISYRHIQYGSTNGESLVPFNVAAYDGAERIHFFGISNAGNDEVAMPVARDTTLNRICALLGTGDTPSANTIYINGDPVSKNYLPGLLIKGLDYLAFAAITTTAEQVMGSWGLGRLTDLNSEAIGIMPFQVRSQPQNTTAYMLGAGHSTTYATVESEVQIPMRAGTLKNLALKNSGTGVAGQTWTATVRKNGADTALGVILTGTQTINADTANTVTVADGDLISIRIVSSATTGTRGLTASMEHVP